MATAELTTKQQTPFSIEPITFEVQAAQIQTLADEYLPLRIAGLDDKAGFDAVYQAQQKVKKLRIAVEKRREDLKKSSLEYGRKVDQAAKQLQALIEPIESHLTGERKRIEDEKQRIEREKAEARRRIVQGRVDALLEVGCVLSYATVDAMSDEAYEAKLDEATEAKRIADEKAAAEEAERQRKQAEEEARIKAEQERLAAERAELERKAAEQRAREEAFQRKQGRCEALQGINWLLADITEESLSLPDAEWEAFYAKALADYQAKVEAEEAEARRIAEEEAAKARAEDEARRKAEIEQAQREAAERARIETEERLKREAEEKRRQEEEAELEQKRVEAAAPDRKKLLALADAIDRVYDDSPTISDEEARQKVGSLISNMTDMLRGIAKNLRGKV